jgi:hypothetical protein
MAAIVDLHDTTIFHYMAASWVVLAVAAFISQVKQSN